MYYVLLPLAVVGLWQARRRHGLVVSLLVLALCSSLVFRSIAGTRYRAPLERLIVVLAASAPRRLRERSAQPQAEAEPAGRASAPAPG